MPQPSQVDAARSRIFDTSQMEPLKAVSPMGDTASAPDTAEPAEEVIPPGLLGLRQAQEQLAADEAAPVKKDSRLRAFLKMLAYGAKDMPMARDWAEFAHGAGKTVGSGVVGAVSPKTPGEIKKRYQIARDVERVERAQKTASIESQIGSRANTARVQNARLGIAQTKAEQDQDRAKRKAVADDLKRLPYIDPEDPTHAKILARAKAAGIDVDPESYGKGKNRPRIKVLDDDGVTEHWFEKDVAKGWVPIKIEGRNAVSGMTDKRNPLTGETYSSEQRRDLAKQKFDWQKIEARIDNNRAERALALQKQGVEMRVAQAQGEVDAIDEVLPTLENDLIEQSGAQGDPIIAEQIQRSISALKDRRGRAAGLASAKAEGKSYKFTEADVRARAKAQGRDENAAVKAARDSGMIP